ncbi:MULTISPECIES: septal ring lytic transglycosylase RlpA family protein [Bradyrhizobium]|jgi:rare lipoprotein A|uniref:Endolytic peptidoglycan transglycosylase RlpA n=2 Tax=Bradyrhizobium TaxID=374 RepID=A0ABY0PN98_9BRAD|nr:MULTISPECIES: septal ring lytic transglycosylase RlpA family protein [Bradyrhizobium]SDI68219.1 rare lipoprotein A [Bradyrhizobium ottawaense]SED29724.1 rare lipoprotein A [Bradyrhizobium lablabi]SHL33119.1 rare lipoprotein A [Bradyrhizobium lablabi]
MLNTNKAVLGNLTRSRTAFALIAATLLVGGSVSEASAKSRHHRHHAHQAAKSTGGDWRDANASMGGTSGGHSFTGMASFYGNESGSKTASGQRFNQNAMTCAHRSLPFGTKLRVTHRGQSVVVTVNDRGPFIKGRVLDLSTGAARAIGLTSAGVGHVTAEVVS